MDTPICILGGGPGGCSAALQLAKFGRASVIIEKAVFPRDKVCGDALSGKVMRTLERLDMDLANTVKRHACGIPSWGVTFVAPNGKALKVPFSRETGIGEAPGGILPRLNFDDLLFQRTKETHNIMVLEGATAQQFERIATGWTITLQDGRTITTRTIIDASGANSRFSRHTAGLQLDPKHHAAGVRAYYTNVTGLDQQGFIELIFLKELLPGYLWIFPLPNGRANIGLGLRSDVVKKRRVDIKALMVDMITTHPQLKDRFVHAQLEGSIQGMGLPLASKQRPLSGEGYLLVGDAGHLIDPFTGEGISHAMISGVYAADTMVALAPNTIITAEQGKVYDARVWKRLGKEVAISARLQQMANAPWLFNFVVDRASTNPALAATISSMFNDLDLREKLKRPKFYLDLVLGRRSR